MTKYLIFDSGALINITQNCLLSVFKDLNKAFQGEFIIPDEVRYETVEHPMKIKRFGWGAIRIQALLDGVLKLPEDEELCTKKELEQKTGEVMDLANNALSANGKSIHLIERGEAECLALSLILSEKKLDNAVVIDERTARMLCENPNNLQEIMKSKLETGIKVDMNKLKIFEKIKVLRSTEMVYIAFKKNLIDHDRRKLEAMLYALKFGGCSVSEKEIQAMSKM